MSKSKAFSAARPLKPHLLQETGGLAAEIQDVRNDVDTAFETFEKRTGYPALTTIAGSIAAAGGTVTLTGTDLLQGGVCDHAHLVQVAIDVSITATKPGVSGYSFVMTTGGGGSTTATFTPSTGVLAIALKTGGDTAANVAAAINAATGNAGYVFAAVVGAGTFTLAVASTPLAGGVGSMADYSVFVGGTEFRPIEPWTGTTVKITTTAMGTAGDPVLVQVTAGGITSQLSATLA